MTRFYERNEASRTDYVTTAEAAWTVAAPHGVPWVITVPAGFVFQISVPRWLEWAFDPHDPRFLAAAAYHDWSLHLDTSRGLSALIFYQVLVSQGVGRWKAGAMAAATIARAPKDWR